MASDTQATAQQQGKSIPLPQVRARFLYKKYFKSKLHSQAGTAWDWVYESLMKFWKFAEPLLFSCYDRGKRKEVMSYQLLYGTAWLSARGLKVSPSLSAIAPSTSLWDTRGQVPALPLTLRDPQHEGTSINGQLAALNTLETENQPSAATAPSPSPRGHRGEGKGLAVGVFTRKLDPHKVLKHDSQSPRCWVLGSAFPRAAQGLFGSWWIKLSAEQATCSSAALPASASVLSPFRKIRPLIQAPHFRQCLNFPYLWGERDECRAWWGGQRAASSWRAEDQNQHQPAAPAGEQKAPAQSCARDNAAALEHFSYSLQSLITCRPDNLEHKFCFCK